MSLKELWLVGNPLTELPRTLDKAPPPSPPLPARPLPATAMGWLPGIAAGTRCRRLAASERLITVQQVCEPLTSVHGAWRDQLMQLRRLEVDAALKPQARRILEMARMKRIAAARRALLRFFPVSQYLPECPRCAGRSRTAVNKTIP